MPTHAFELVEVAAVREAALSGHIESRPPIEKPLDVLVQHAVTVALGWEQHRIGLTFAAAGKRLLAVPEWSRNNFLQLQGWINLYVSPTEAVQMTVDRARAAFRVRARRGY